MPKSARAVPAILIAYSDSDFTNPHEVVLPSEPKDRRGEFSHMGAQYWGFESRRHLATRVNAGARRIEYDHAALGWLLIGLERRTKVDRIRISTKWFTGNHVRAVSVILVDDLTGGAQRVLERKPLKPDSEHVFRITPFTATECCIEVHHDGGIARIELFGTPAKEQPPARRNLLENARISHASNTHFGTPELAVAGRRKQKHMVGWESARTGFGERALFHLRKPAVIDEVVVDTYLHRLNAPLTAHVFAVNAGPKDIARLMKQAPRWAVVFDGRKEVVPDDFRDYMLNQRYLKERGVKNREQFAIRLHTPRGCPWKPILAFAPLRPDTLHRFRDLNDVGPVTHVLYMHFDNGGIHALRMFGAESRR